MKKNIECKKCQSTQFTFQEVINKNKAKYYKTCNTCGKVFRLHPENNAYHFFSEYCKMEARLKYKDTEDKNYCENVVKEEKRLRKENTYVKNNFEILFKYIIRNNLEKDKKIKLTLKVLIDVLIRYRNPLTDEDCKNILDEITQL